ncbi:hypothetical protein PBY51_004066 [Eleginops maclovinus]|nr:hypothetical protein PBY51_004066 [Eleginops maclovinus]
MLALASSEPEERRGPYSEWIRSAVKYAGCGHWLALTDFTLSQVSRHVCLSIVSGQQLPLQGAGHFYKGCPVL